MRGIKGVFTDGAAREARTRPSAAIGAAVALGMGLALAPMSPATGVGDPATLASLFDDGLANPLIVLGDDYNIIQPDPGLMVPSGAAVILDLNGKQLTVVRDGNYAGIRVPPTATLTIRDSGTTGGLTVRGGAAGAGIGGDYNESAGTIIINTSVSVTSPFNGAGIGGGMGARGGTVIIDVPGGVVTATSGQFGAGIGGGLTGHGGVTTILSGTVIATGGSGGAGIGGGLGGDGGQTTIEGGTVTATGGSGGAGIGGGTGGKGGQTTIEGGTVTATGGLTGAAIGGGAGGIGGDVEIGALATVTVDNRGTVIGEGIASTSGPATMDPVRFGSLTNAGTLNVRGGAALLLPTGVTVGNTGAFVVQTNGRTSNAGTIMNSGTVSVDGTFVNSGAIVNTGAGQVETPDWSKVTVNDYLVGFDATGGTVANPSIRVFAESFDVAQVSLPVPSRTGHTFTSWHPDAAGAGSPLTTSTTLGTGNGPVSVDFYAAWTVNVHTVTFHSQGGSAVPSSSTDYGTAVAAPVDPVRAGFGFTGWFSAPSSGSTWNFADPITTDLTLYAMWTPTASPPPPVPPPPAPPTPVPNVPAPGIPPIPSPGTSNPVPVVPSPGTSVPAPALGVPGQAGTGAGTDAGNDLAHTGVGDGLVAVIILGAVSIALGALLLIRPRRLLVRGDQR